jgi:hypothetical protein
MEAPRRPAFADHYACIFSPAKRNFGGHRVENVIWYLKQLIESGISLNQIPLQTEKRLHRVIVIAPGPSHRHHRYRRRWTDIFMGHDPVTPSIRGDQPNGRHRFRRTAGPRDFQPKTTSTPIVKSGAFNGEIGADRGGKVSPVVLARSCPESAMI